MYHIEYQGLLNNIIIRPLKYISIDISLQSRVSEVFGILFLIQNIFHGANNHLTTKIPLNYASCFIIALVSLQ